MSPCRLTIVLAVSATLTAFAQERKLPGTDPRLPDVGMAMQAMIATNEIAGAVTAVVARDKILHFETTGLADVAAKRPMAPGAWGTQAWIDPVKGVAYVLMVQRSNFPNSDASDVRRDFQQAAADALERR
jgi:CubicO group peptidase (beta-lactamase class C family)